MSRFALSLAFAMALCGSAFAASKPDKDAPPPGSSVEMPYLIAPMIDSDGKLLAYAYVSTKIVANSPDDAVEVRNKTPFIQDTFVRDVNTAPFAKQGDPTTVDQGVLQGRLLADVRKVVGGSRIATLVITQIQISPLQRAVPQG